MLQPAIKKQKYTMTLSENMGVTHKTGSDVLEVGIRTPDCMLHGGSVPVKPVEHISDECNAQLPVLDSTPWVWKGTIIGSYLPANILKKRFVDLDQFPDIFLEGKRIREIAQGQVDVDGIDIGGFFVFNDVATAVLFENPIHGAQYARNINHVNPFRAPSLLYMDSGHANGKCKLALMKPSDAVKLVLGHKKFSNRVLRHNIFSQRVRGPDCILHGVSVPKNAVEPIFDKCNVQLPVLNSTLWYWKGTIIGSYLPANILKKRFVDLDQFPDIFLEGKRIREIGQGQVDVDGIDIGGFFVFSDIAAALLFENPIHGAQYARNINLVNLIVAPSLTYMESGHENGKGKLVLMKPSDTIKLVLAHCNFRKRVYGEQCGVGFFEGRVRGAIDMAFDGFIHNKTFLGQTQRRIDHRLLIDNTILAIETDEFAHRSYGESNENARYRIFLDYTSHKFVFIRFNCNSNMERDDAKTDFDYKIHVLLHTIVFHMDRIRKGQNQLDLEVYKLFY